MSSLSDMLSSEIATLRAQAAAAAAPFMSKVDVLEAALRTLAPVAVAEPMSKRQMTAEQEAEQGAELKARLLADRKAKKLAAKAAYLLLHPGYLEGMNCLKNDRGDVVSEDGEWLGHWTGHAIDFGAPIPADFDQLTAAD